MKVRACDEFFMCCRSLEEEAQSSLEAPLLVPSSSEDSLGEAQITGTDVQSSIQAAIHRIPFAKV